MLAQTFVYECQDNKNFVLQIREHDAWLFSKGLSTSLRQVPSASGLKYENDDIVFFSKGYEAFLITPGMKYELCSNNRFKAIWEDAKLRGNDFRAIGNEPGWYLEIAHNGAKTLLVTDYGNEKYELSFPKPLHSVQTRTTRYRIKGFIDIYIESKKCQDSMTGHNYESMVKVIVDGKVYRGCGKTLH